MKESEDPRKKHKLINSLLDVLKFVAVYGIVEIILLYITKGDKMKEILIHVIIFVIITTFLIFNPEYSE